MRVELLHHTPLAVVVRAIRKCYASEDKSDSDLCKNFIGEKDQALIKSIIASGHGSVLEHCTLTFNVDGISRGCLQELARHRISSFSVKSTRYTLGKLKTADSFTTGGTHNEEWRQYLVESGNEFVDYNSRVQLEEVRQGALAGIPNDKLKYMLPESFKTSLIWTINVRSLRNFLQLRLASRAHWEIRKLAYQVVEAIPETHRVLFYDITA